MSSKVSSLKSVPPKKRMDVVNKSGQVFFLHNFLKSFFRSVKPLASRSPISSISQAIVSFGSSTIILTGDRAFFLARREKRTPDRTQITLKQTEGNYIIGTRWCKECKNKSRSILMLNTLQSVYFTVGRLILSSSVFSNYSLI